VNGLRSRHRGVAIFALGILGLTSGCAMNRRYVHDSVRQIAHRNVTIQYTVEAMATTPTETEPEPIATGRREMELVYPHPSPRYGRNFAQVTVRNAADAADQASSVWDRVRHPVRQAFHAQIERETAEGNVTIAVPREDVELLLQDLIADGLFDRGERLGNGVRLAVAIGSRSVDKDWDRVDALERLATRAAVTGAGRRATPNQQPVSTPPGEKADEVQFLPNTLR
jgi:hypothetical protein